MVSPKGGRHRLVERNGLSPGLVVVSENGFFGPGLSATGAAILERSRWAAFTDSIEAHVAFYFRHYLGRWFPHLLPRLFSQESLWVELGWLELLRSSGHGSWLVRRLTDQRVPLQSWNRNLDAPGDVARARAFKSLVEARGGRLVLTFVPSNGRGRSYAEARRIAKQIGVPFVAPQLDNVTLYEGAHLSSDSANRCATALLAELETRGLLAPRPVRE